jgi:hypothetical protein
MIEEMKFALLAESTNGAIGGYFGVFWLSNTCIRLDLTYILIEEFEGGIQVYFDDEKAKYFGHRKIDYLNRQNSLRTFTSVSSAVGYVKYLCLAAIDAKLEQYHYFLFRLRELKITYEGMSYVNTGMESEFIRCEIGGIQLDEVPVGYNLLVLFSQDGTTRLSFYPKEPQWNEGKDCPETELDRILDYFLRFSGYKYDDIPLQEV